VRDVIHADDRLVAQERVDTALASRSSLASEYRIVLPSGEVRWISALGNTTYDENGRRSGCQASASTSRRASRPRRSCGSERQRFLETVVITMPAAVTLIRGSDLRLRLVNPAYQPSRRPPKCGQDARRALAPDRAGLHRDLPPRPGNRGTHSAVDEPNMIRRRPGGPLERAYFSWSLHRVRLPGDEGWAS